MGRVAGGGGRVGLLALDRTKGRDWTRVFLPKIPFCNPTERRQLKHVTPTSLPVQ